MAEFTGRTVLVTGGGSGLGRAIALAFSAEGARVMIAGRRLEPLRETAASAAAASSPAGTAAAPGPAAAHGPAAAPEPMLCVAADLSREEDRAKLSRAAAEALGGLDVLVHSAGILESGSLETTGLDDWDRTMNINVTSLYALTRLALPMLAARRGSIVNLSSVAGLRPYPGLLAYCVSKAAVDQLTRCLALELAPKGVRVNALNPGVVVTNLHRAGGMSETDYAAFLERGKSTHPLGRVGAPADVAALALFLASERAAWITGGTFSVDGGRALASAR